MSDIEHWKRLVPTLSHDGKEWVAAEDYDTTLQAFEDWRQLANERGEQLAGAVDLLRQIGEMAGAKANGADARAMAQRAREFLASLDHPGGQ